MKHGIAAALAASVVLAACSNPVDNASPRCPQALLVGDASNLVRFAKGSGRAVGDMAYEATFTGYRGSCEYSERGVEVRLATEIEVERGPAGTDGVIGFSYFVALPDRANQAGHKQVFPVRGSLAANKERMSYRDDIELFIPLKTPADGPATQIFLGFQLSPNEVEYNRNRRRKR